MATLPTEIRTIATANPIYNAVPMTSDHTVLTVATSSDTMWAPITLDNFATVNTVDELVSKLAETVYSQELRIRALEEKLNERSTETIK